MWILRSARIVFAPSLIYFLGVEGGTDLTPDDAAAKENLAKFVSTKPPAADDGNPVLPKDLIL